MPDVYWHTRKRLWSVRIGGRVLLHEPEMMLGHVRLVVRLSAVERIRRTRQREVCAWATGVQTHTGEMVPWLMREVSFDPFASDAFRYVDDGTPITECRGMRFAPDGRAWAWDWR